MPGRQLAAFMSHELDQRPNVFERTGPSHRQNHLFPEPNGRRHLSVLSSKGEMWSQLVGSRWLTLDSWPDVAYRLLVWPWSGPGPGPASCMLPHTMSLSHKTDVTSSDLGQSLRSWLGDFVTEVSIPWPWQTMSPWRSTNAPWCKTDMIMILHLPDLVRQAPLNLTPRPDVSSRRSAACHPPL